MFLGDVFVGIDICNSIESLAFRAFLNVRELALGLRREKCRSTHFSIANTESVDDSRRSADVLIIDDDAIRKVAAMPFRACN